MVKNYLYIKRIQTNAVEGPKYQEALVAGSATLVQAIAGVGDLVVFPLKSRQKVFIGYGPHQLQRLCEHRVSC
jgi:hypothetical protein